MNAIAGIPYIEANFDKNGKLTSPVTLPAGVTDVIVISHGWNNDKQDAEQLYTALFTNFVAVAQPNDLPNRSFAIIGVIWPSKRFDELVAATATSGAADGSAGLSAPASAESDKLLAAKIDGMEALFPDAAAKAVLAQLRALIPNLQESGTARRKFVDAVRSLLDKNAQSAEDASDAFFKDDGNDIMTRLKVDEDDLDPQLTETGGSASLPLGVGVVKPAAGGAAGFLSFLSGFKAAAMNVLNFATYFEMKSRAGTVGKNGVAPLIDGLPASVQRIHLVGHSFGGRVVTSTAANSTTNKIKSMSLLQTAFSHNGFSQSAKGFFRSVVDSKRVNGPILVTFTPNDKAVGIAYPTASRLSGDTTAALGDKNDKFGGLGRNGAQKMNGGEVIDGKLLPAGSAYQFQSGKFFNLESSDFIKGHSVITGKEVAHAVRRAIAAS
jgi:hypothetical protein